MFGEKDIEFVGLNENLVDAVWGSDKVKPEISPIIEHPLEFVEQTVADKTKKVREAAKGSDAALVTALDDIAWLTNMRAKDIPYNPLFFSYAIVQFEKEGESIRLYVDEEKTKGVTEYLKDNRIEVFPYEQIFDDLSGPLMKGKSIAYDSNVCSRKVYDSLKDKKINDVPELVQAIKQIKTDREVRGFTEC